MAHDMQIAYTFRAMLDIVRIRHWGRPVAGEWGRYLVAKGGKE